jgi:hypothetical protein
VNTPASTSVDPAQIQKFQFVTNFISGIFLLFLLAVRETSLQSALGWDFVCRITWTAFFASWLAYLFTRAFPHSLSPSAGRPWKAISFLFNGSVPFLTDAIYQFGPDRVLTAAAG